VTASTTSMPGFLVAMAGAEDVTWSIATFGAIAEFSRAPGEAGHAIEEGKTGEEGFRIVTPRGGLRYRHSPHAKIIAYEGLSKDPKLWSQGISICLPERDARMASAHALTETGPDVESFHERDRTHTMFDIGLGAPHIAACVRTSDADLTTVLRDHAGQSLFEGEGEGKGKGEALHAIHAHNPDRVFTSPLGRIEVATPIAHEDGETATGPHTHVLPELLATGRTHAATVPIPDGYLPCMNLFPPNPARDERGEARSFDEGDHRVFQAILAEYGDPAANAIKQQVIESIAAGHGPGDILSSESRPLNLPLNLSLNRIERTALRVTLRQVRYTTGHNPVLDDWLTMFETNNSDNNSDKGDS